MEQTITKVEKTIKLTRDTLPGDHQKVKWQTLVDIYRKKWKQGVYDAKSQCFLIGFDPVITCWDAAEIVEHWTKY